jgi:hypothetical protein
MTHDGGKKRPRQPRAEEDYDNAIHAGPDTPYDHQSLFGEQPSTSAAGLQSPDDDMPPAAGTGRSEQKAADSATADDTTAAAGADATSAGTWIASPSSPAPAAEVGGLFSRAACAAAAKRHKERMQHVETEDLIPDLPVTGVANADDYASAPNGTAGHPDPAAAAEGEFVGSGLDVRAGQGVFVPDWILIVTRNGDERLILGQLAYWFRPKSDCEQKRRGAFFDPPHWWTGKTYRQLGREVCMTKRKVRHVMTKLVAAGLVVAGPHEYRGRRCNRYRLNAARIQEAYHVATAAGVNVGEEDDKW